MILNPLKLKMNKNTAAVSTNITESTHSSCERFDDLLTRIEQMLNDPYNFTYEAITFLKNVVQLNGETMKLEIDAKMNRMINKLDEYKNESKMSLNQNEYLMKSANIREEIDESRKILDKWLSELKEVKLDENEILSRVKNESEQAIERFEIKLDLFKSELLLSKFRNFRREIKDTFGYFECDPMFYIK